MKGRVSLEVEDDEEVTTIIRKPSAEKSRLGAGQRKIRGLGAATTEEPTPINFSEIQDRSMLVDDITIPEDSSMAFEEDDEMVAKIQNARNIRAGRAQEKLLGDYISLETTTQKHLDDYDIATMVRQGRGLGRSIWEDPEDGVQAPKEESSGEEGPVVDDSLDMEHFKGHLHASGRINMEVQEEASMEGLDINKIDFEDEEARLWEMQQIRKGFASTGKVSREMRKTVKSLSTGLSGEKAEPKTPISIVSLPLILTKLNKEMAFVDTTLEEAKANLRQVEICQAESKASLSEVEKKMQASAEQAAFFHQLQEYLDAFSEMIDEIEPAIKELEEEWTRILHSHTDDTGQVALRIQDLFAEVDPKFSSPKGILDLLEEWKIQFNDSYKNAYVDESIPGLVEAFARANLVGWDPLETPEQVENFMDDCCGCGVEFPEMVKNKIHASIFIPKLLSYLAASYSPIVDHKTRGVVAVFKILQRRLPPTSRVLLTLKGILSTVLMETDLIDEKLIDEKDAKLIDEKDVEMYLKSSVTLGKLFGDDALISSAISRVDTVPAWVDKLRVDGTCTADFVKYLIDHDARCL